MRVLLLVALLGCGRLKFGELGSGDGGGSNGTGDGGIDGPPPTSCVSRIASGGHTHLCAIKDNLPFCWGTADGGELGDGVAMASRKVPTPSPALSGAGTFANAGTGGHWSCWITLGGGNVVCAGKNNHGQLGRSAISSFETVGAAVNGLPPVADLVVGAQHACAREANGALWCWGCQEYGAGSDCIAFSTTAAMLATNVTALPPGQRRGGCYETGGALACWGANEEGQLGNGATGTTVISIDAAPILFAGAVQIAHGRRHACGRTLDGTVACWGANNSGQLGRGPIGIASDPQPAVIDVPPIVELVAGADHTCGRTAGGDVYCWGGNGEGQCGIGTGPNVDAPVRAMIDGVSALGAYSYGTCAARADGMYCWGDGNNGVLASGVVGPDLKVPTLSLLTCP